MVPKFLLILESEAESLTKDEGQAACLPELKKRMAAHQHGDDESSDWRRDVIARLRNSLTQRQPR